MDDLTKKAISNLQHKAPIVRAFKGYIVMAQDEWDYTGKIMKITRGHTAGFYTVKQAFHLKKP